MAEKFRILRLLIELGFVNKAAHGGCGDVMVGLSKRIRENLGLTTVEGSPLSGLLRMAEIMLHRVEFQAILLLQI